MRVIMTKTLIEYNLYGSKIDLPNLSADMDFIDKFAPTFDNEMPFMRINISRGEIKGQLYSNGKLLIHSKSLSYIETSEFIYLLQKFLEKFSMKKIGA
jgi:hypothetical protein